MQRLTTWQSNSSTVIATRTALNCFGHCSNAGMKTIHRDTPVILSTGYGESEAAQRFAGKDVAGFLQKPYMADQLIEALATVLGP